jgi:hypothetical protein
VGPRDRVFCHELLPVMELVFAAHTGESWSASDEETTAATASKASGGAELLYGIADLFSEASVVLEEGHAVDQDGFAEYATPLRTADGDRLRSAEVLLVWRILCDDDPSAQPVAGEPTEDALLNISQLMTRIVSLASTDPPKAEATAHVHIFLGGLQMAGKALERQSSSEAAQLLEQKERYQASLSLGRAGSAASTFRENVLNEKIEMKGSFKAAGRRPFSVRALIECSAS